MAVDIGQKAPDFSLLDADGNTVSLAGMAGQPVVLAFYPGAFTGPCQEELCTFRDSLADYEDLNAQVLGISVDSRFANGAFAAQNSLTFPLLSDYRHQAITAYGIVHEGLGGMEGYVSARRSVFVIDADGKLVWRWLSEQQGQAPPYDEVKRAVESLA